MSLAEQYAKLQQIPNLRERTLLLATEDTGTFLKSVGSFFTSKIQAIREFFTSEAVAYKLKSDPFIEELYKTYKSNEKDISKLDYMGISKMRIPYPELFIKNLYDTSSVLKNISSELNRVFMKSIDDTDTMISKAIQDISYLKSNRPLKDNAERDKVIDICYKGLDTILDSNKRKDTVTVQEAIPNLSTIENVVLILNDVSKLDMYKDAVKADKIAKSIKEKIDELVRELNRAKDNGISKAGLANLATELESSAKLITLMSTVLYCVSQAADATSTMIKMMLGKKV